MALVVALHMDYQSYILFEQRNVAIHRRECPSLAVAANPKRKSRSSCGITCDLILVREKGAIAICDCLALTGPVCTHTSQCLKHIQSVAELFVKISSEYSIFSSQPHDMPLH